ncbi:MAG: DNA-directed RNA polymerase subunit alpha [Candidatus Yanofskybacteria bacterium]|nr:DNA-directed RNA polymerase subunit alpha [Candidatus Yanofskybacteria bacterium]
MFQLPTEPKVVSKNGNQAVFEIGPLFPGYGTTIGNTLRRVLMSSLDGAAITFMKIKGVDHEFSAISGVLEDVIEIILNLKRVRFKLFSDEPVTLVLSSKGEGEVTAANIKSTSDVEIINKNQHIATVTDKKIEFEMEITVERGIGYVPAEQRQKEKLSVGKIAIDGIFTPIRNVNFTVENIRVGQRTDYNKVLLDVETDGSISPEEALKKASQILVEHFTIIKNVELPTEEAAKEKPKKSRKKKSEE